MKVSVEDWVKSLTLPEEQSKTVLTALAADGVKGKVEESIAMRSDYSRAMDGLNQEKRTVEQLKKRNTDYYGEVTKWRSDAEKEINNLRDTVRKSNESVATYRARLETMVQTGVLDKEDVADLLKAEGNTTTTITAPTTTTTTSNEPTNNYLTAEQFRKEAMDFARFPAKLMDLNARHMTIFQKPLDGIDELFSETMRRVESGEKVTVTDVWREKYKVDDREKEIETKRQQEHDDAIRREERQKVMSEVSNPTSRPTGAFSSPVLERFRPKNPATDSHNPMRGVMAAVQATEAGKYNEGHEQR